MERRTFLGLLALPAVAQLVAACGDSGGDAVGPSAAKTAALKGTAARITSGVDPSAAAGSVNAFAADLFDQLTTADPTKNLVFSPLSIAVALAMVSGGAKGTTLAELDGVLHVTDPRNIHRSMNGLTAAFDAANRTQSLAAQGGEGVHEVKVHITNSLWAQSGLRLEQPYLDLLSSEYGAGMETVDYAADAERARVAINAWVEDATEGRIPELLVEGALSPSTLLTLVNAVYLKANWADSFLEAATKDEPFTNAAGDRVTAHMMHGGGEWPYGEGEGWQAVEVPYAFGDLGMVLAVGATAGTPLPDAEQVFPQLAPHRVQLGLPKFDFGTATSLGATLQAMGVTTSFTDRADFSGITADANLFITDVVHQANITVDETGTEAAAATAATMAGTAAPADPPAVVNLDRPFTFWIRERGTGAVLFMGRVNDPTS
jgi:serpin B